jgi:hypothetical protein
MGTRRKHHFHLPLTHLSSYQRGIKLFNTLPTHITELQNDKTGGEFRLALRNYLQTNVFYSINEFMDHVKGLKDKSD